MMTDTSPDNTLHRYIDQIRPTHLSRILFFILLFIITIFIYFASPNITIGVLNQPSPISTFNSHNTTDRNHSSIRHTQLEVVLSYYAEDVELVARFIRYLRNSSTLQNLSLRIVLYNKNSRINTTYLQAAAKADVVQQLANLGREGETYLHHIIEHYHALPNHILFCQAGVEGIVIKTGISDWFIDRMERQFNASVGYMPLVDMTSFATFDCGVRSGENIPRLADLWAIVEQKLCPPGGQGVAFRGQFLVSAKRIRHRPLHLYKYIHEMLTANQTHWLHNDPRAMHFVQSTRDNPNFGHLLERLWTILFGCAPPDLFQRCERRECACFDENTE